MTENTQFVHACVLAEIDVMALIGGIWGELLVTAHLKLLFRAGKGWRGPPQHVGACGHRFPPFGPSGTTRAGEREGMPSLGDNW